MVPPDTQRYLPFFPLAPCIISHHVLVNLPLHRPLLPASATIQRALAWDSPDLSSLTFLLQRVHHWAAVPQPLPHTPQPILCGRATFLRHRSDRTARCLESCQWVFITDRAKFTFLSTEHEALPTDLPASSLSIFSHSRDCSLWNSPGKPAQDVDLAFRGASSPKTPWCLRG